MELTETTDNNKIINNNRIMLQQNHTIITLYETTYKNKKQE